MYELGDPRLETFVKPNESQPKLTAILEGKARLPEHPHLLCRVRARPCEPRRSWTRSFLARSPHQSEEQSQIFKSSKVPQPRAFGPRSSELQSQFESRALPAASFSVQQGFAHDRHRKVSVEEQLTGSAGHS